jgi:hypothetical protein
VDAIALLDRAIDGDPRFTLAYCRLAEAHDILYYLYDHTPEQRNLADTAISRALASEPDLPEVQLIYAEHLYYAFRDYERAREHLAIAKRDLPNDTEATALEAFMDRRQGHWEKAIQEFKDALERDPGNSISVENLALTLERTRQFRAAEQMYDRLIALRPDHAILDAQKPLLIYRETGDDTAIRAAIAAFPGSISDDRGVLCLRLSFAFVDRDWAQAKELIEKLDGGDDEGDFAYVAVNVPVGCYSILLARLQGEETAANRSFAETRELLNERAQKAPETAPFLSILAALDALLNNKEIAIAEAKRAVELMPISKDAVEGPLVQLNLAVVYAWTNELDLAFETLSPLTKIPNGLFYGELKRNPYWDPLRKDPRYDKLLGELAPRN